MKEMFSSEAALLSKVILGRDKVTDSTEKKEKRRKGVGNMYVHM